MTKGRRELSFTQRIAGDRAREKIAVAGCCGENATAPPPAPGFGPLPAQAGTRTGAPRGRRNRSWTYRLGKCKVCRERTTSTILKLGVRVEAETCGPLLERTLEHCGCVLKLKVHVPWEKCPQGYW